MYSEISLIVVEYPNGKVAVQAIIGNKEASKIFDDCSRADKEVRMSLVSLELQGTNITTSGRTKMVSEKTTG